MSEPYCSMELKEDLVIFKGKNHVVRYRFVNLQQALDGSTVLTLLPAGVDVPQLSIIRDRLQWSRLSARDRNNVQRRDPR